MIEVKTSAEGLFLKIYVQPKSARNQIAGIHGDALKLKITSPPVGGAANKTCIQFLARQLAVAKSRLEIVSGRTSRIKRVLIKADADELQGLKQKIASFRSR